MNHGPQPQYGPQYGYGYAFPHPPPPDPPELPEGASPYPRWPAWYGPAAMGLGLAVCRTIIAAHRGKLWAENNADAGACFVFTLPTHEADSTAGARMNEASING